MQLCGCKQSLQELMGTLHTSLKLYSHVQGRMRLGPCRPLLPAPGAQIPRVCSRLPFNTNNQPQAMTGCSTGDTACEKAQQLLKEHQGRTPKCLVLDLDYTVWKCWCEMYSVHDAPPLYPEAEGIIDACRQEGILVTAASRTPTPDVARAFLRKSGLDAKFDNIQLIPAADGFDSYSAQKDTCHLPNIKAATGLEWRDMLFFDDESGNVHKVQRLGVCSILVPTSIGLCLKTFQEGLEKYAAQYG